MADKIKIPIDFEIDGAIVSAQDLKKQVQGIADEAKKAADKLAAASAKGQELFDRGMGGGESAEKLKKIREGFSLYGDTANTATVRNQALVGSLGMLARGLFGAAEGAVRFAQNIAEATARADVHQRAIDALGASYEATNRITHEAMSAEQQLGVHTALLSQNIFLSAEQTAVANRAMREFAIIHGGTATDAIGRFSQAVQSADNGALAQFGVHIGAGVPAADRMTVALRQLEEAQRHQAGISTTASEAAENHRSTLSRLGDQLYQLADPFSALDQRVAEHSREETNAARASSELTQQMLAEKNAAEALKDAHNHVTESLDHGKEVMRTVLNQTLEYVRVMNLASSAGSNFAFDPNQTLAQQGERRLMAARQMIANRRAQAEQDRSIRAALRSEGVSGSDLAAQFGGGGGQRENHDSEIAAGLAQAAQEIAADRARLAAHNEFLAARYDAENEDIQRRRQLVQDWNKEQLQAENDNNHERERNENARMMAEERRAAESNSLQAQLSQRFAQHAETRETTAQGMASIVDNAYQTMTSGLQQHIGAVLSGTETIGQAAKEEGKQVLLGMAEQAGAKAIFQFGEGLANTARLVGSYGADAGAGAAAAANFASGAEYLAFAALAGGAYAAVSAIPSGSPAAAAGASQASSGQTARAGSPSSNNSQSGNSPTYVYNFSGIMGNEQTQAALRSTMQDMHVRRQLPQFMRQP